MLIELQRARWGLALASLFSFDASEIRSIQDISGADSISNTRIVQLDGHEFEVTDSYFDVKKKWEAALREDYALAATESAALGGVHG